MLVITIEQGSRENFRVMNFDHQLNDLFKLKGEMS